MGKAKAKGGGKGRKRSATQAEDVSKQLPEARSHESDGEGEGHAAEGVTPAVSNQVTNPKQIKSSSGSKRSRSKKTGAVDDGNVKLEASEEPPGDGGESPDLGKDAAVKRCRQSAKDPEGRKASGATQPQVIIGELFLTKDICLDHFWGRYFDRCIV